MNDDYETKKAEVLAKREDPSCQHCWHSQSGSISNRESVSNDRCCFCGTTRTTRIEFPFLATAPKHGPFA